MVSRYISSDNKIMNLLRSLDLGGAFPALLWIFAHNMIWTVITSFSAAIKNDCLVRDFSNDE